MKTTLGKLMSRDKTWSRLSAAIAGLCLSAMFNTADAGGFSGALIELWVSDSNATTRAWLRTTATVDASCPGQNGGYMYIELTEPNGREAYAMALAAFVAGKNVKVGGAGVCSGAHEKVRYLYMTQ